MKFLSDNVNINDLTYINCIYQRDKDDDGKKVDYISIVYKDKGEKKLKVIKNPKIEFYMVKPEYRNYDYNKAFLEIDKLDKHVCKYKDLIFEIAKYSENDNLKNYIKQCMETGNYRMMNNAHKYPFVFGSDIDIETFYRLQWLDEYDNDSEKKLTKQYMDIEVDSINVPGFPEMGQCPINAVTLIDEESKTSHTFLLYNENNPLIKEFMDNINSFINELHDAFDESYGYIDYKIYMYYDERELIKDVFKLINTLKRDFILLYNGNSFDNPYMIERCKKLGMNPEDVMCHKDFPFKICRIIKDIKNFKVANKSDAFKLSSYTKFIDQMILYAATRKGQSELRSNNLQYIAQIELNDEKLDYTDEANIKTLPYKNYKKFVMYNIKDVLLQLGIERRTNDIENLYLRAYSNAVDYDNVFKQTVTLKSRAYREFYLQNLIIGNNINVDYNGDKKDDSKKFSGAVVGDPLLNSNEGIIIFGKKSKYVYKYVIDMDFSAMYPHMIITFNIERNTMIGKLIIDGITDDRYEHHFIKDESTNTDILDDDYSDEDDMVEDDMYDAGKDFVDNYLTGDTLSICSKWFGLPQFDEIHKDFVNEFSIKPKIKINIPNKMMKFFKITRKKV